MLTKKELGEAIREAIQRKIDSGAVESKAEVARHFGVQPPSLYGWINSGSISKDKLNEFFRYFSDVAGPEHWGMSPSDWPAGLTASGGAIPMLSIAKPPQPLRDKPLDDPLLQELLSVAKKISSAGLHRLIGKAEEMALQFPKAGTENLAA